MEAADLKFVNGKFTEGELEQAIIELFQRQDANGVRWSYANGELLHRRFDEPLMEDRLKSSLRRRYADIDLTEGELQTLVSELKRIPSTPLYDGCRRAFWLINEGYTLLREDANQACRAYRVHRLRRHLEQRFPHREPIHGRGCAHPPPRPFVLRERHTSRHPRV